MRKISCIILSIISITLLALQGCAQKQIDISKFTIGIIETNGTINKSRITFFDKNIDNKKSIDLPYASVGNIFYNPCIYKNNLYVIPQGKSNSKDEKTVLKINLTDFSEKTFRINQLAMNSIAVTENYIYTCNTLNGTSYINKYNITNNTVSKISIANTYISKLLTDANHVYAFATIKENTNSKSYIYTCNSDLEIINKIDITNCGTTHYKAIIKEEKIWFTNTYNAQGAPNNTLSIYDTETGHIQIIQLKEYYPLDLLFHDNYLLIAHYNLVQRNGGGVSLYNPSTSQMKYYNLKHAVEQIATRKDYVYILGDEKIYIYKIDNLSLKLVKSKLLEKNNEDNYFSGIFSY